MKEFHKSPGCALPGGYTDESGAIHRRTVLAPLNGEDEELIGRLAGMTGPSLVTRVLSRCTRQIGSVSPVSESIVRRLPVADRQYLMLQIRRMTLGDTVRGSILCPLPECGAKMDFDFLLSEIPVTAATVKGPLYRMALSGETASDGRPKTIVFRTPTGEDQEALGDLLARDEHAAARALLVRCIRQIDDRASNEEEVAGLSPGECLEIEQKIESVGPRVDLEFEMTCAECGRAFEAPFDLQSFFLNELQTIPKLLYHEVHLLAWHYHWSEREIMAMPRVKRRMYIEILNHALERLHHDE